MVVRRCVVVAVVLESELRSSGSWVGKVGVGGIVGFINSSLCSTSSVVDAIVGCISGVGWLRVSSVAVGRSGMRSFRFMIGSSLAVVGIVVGLSAVGGGIGESTLVSSTMSPVNCVNGCGW